MRYVLNAKASTARREAQSRSTDGVHVAGLYDRRTSFEGLLAMKKFIPVLAVLAIVGLGARFLEPDPISPVVSAPDHDTIASAFAAHRSGLEVLGQGTVTQVLSDDHDGSPHQRFILMLPSGQTILVAHNIALAERIPSLNNGDVVEFKGEYEWNPQGGVIHWTHADPRGRHETGWLKHDGRTYH
jgi:hypothetical protein